MRRRERREKDTTNGGGALMDFVAITVLTSLFIVTDLPRLRSVKWSIKALEELNKMNVCVLKNELLLENVNKEFLSSL